MDLSQMNNKYNGEIVISDDYVISTQPLAQEATESTGSTIIKYMKIHKDKIAQIDAETGQSETYADLLQRSIRTALHMRDRGITRNDIITLCTYHQLNAAVPYAAAQFLGAITASIDPSLSVKEISHLLKQVRPKMMFVVPESLPSIETVVQDIKLETQIVVFGKSSTNTEFDEFLKPHENEEEFKPVQVDIMDTALIHFSSGTTGAPKGICLNHYGFLSQVLNSIHNSHPDYEYIQQQEKRISFPLTVLSYTSFYWISASSIFLTAIFQGYCRLLCSKFDAREAWNFIEKYKPVVLVLTPVQAMSIVDNKPEAPYVNSILGVAAIGSPTSIEYMLKLKDIFTGATVVRSYGQTEASGPLADLRGNNTVHRALIMRKKDKMIESVGLPVPGFSYKVVDVETDKNVGPNERGELRVKSKFILNGYFKADCSETFDEEGWLKTGDIVYFDEDFCFYVVDRIKEAFKYQGWFISPAMIEAEVLSHPAVKQAVVIGVPKIDGHHPLGVVVLKDGFSATEEEIEKFVEGRVPERQRLRAGVKIVKSLPLTVTGKVKRGEVKKMVLGDAINYH